MRLAARFAVMALLASAAPALAEVSWTVHPSEMGSDGPTALYVTARLAGREIRYVPPLRWVVNSMGFKPPGMLEADARVTAAPIPADAPWTDIRGKIARAFVLVRLIPPGATKVSVDIETVNQLQVCSQGACEIGVSYAFYGQEISESFVFVEHNRLQLQFRFGGLKQDFPNLRAQFIASLSSVSGL